MPWTRPLRHIFMKKVSRQVIRIVAKGQMSQVILPAKLEEPFATQPGAAKTWRAVAFPFRLWAKIARFNVASSNPRAKPGQNPHGLLAQKPGLICRGKYVNAKRQNALADLQRFGHAQSCPRHPKGQCRFCSLAGSFLSCAFVMPTVFHAQLLGITAFVATPHGKYLKNFKLTLKDRLIIINLFE